jgi:hypothetical protein
MVSSLLVSESIFESLQSSLHLFCFFFGIFENDYQEKWIL